MADKNKKKEAVDKFRKSPNDAGSTVVQVASLSERINELEKHLKANSKDHSSKRGFLKLISKRKRLMNYLSRKNPEEFKKIQSHYGL